MSYFHKDQTAYIIMPSVELTEAMINQIRIGFHVDGDLARNSLKKSLNGTLTLVKVKLPVHDMFKDYRWYNLDDAKRILNSATWNDGME